MNPNDLTKRLNKAIDVAVDKMETKYSLPAFIELVNRIKQRTRAGYGSNKWGARRKKFVPLEESYINQRQKYGFNSSKTRAKGSNLTRTGEMIDAMRSFFRSRSKFEIGFIENRGDGKYNADIASYHEDGDGPPKRSFMNPDATGVKRFKKELTKLAKKSILKELRKLK